jgi:hypothetical protein
MKYKKDTVCPSPLEYSRKMLFDMGIKPREPPPKESKLRAFMKRGSEPLLGMQITQQVQLVTVRRRTYLFVYYL